ncbi:MAG: sterol desaturase family protein [Bdellovibrionales bacterium]|nr:sterol desaturase family protein [Bdellovibrionales bacterium]
MVTPFYFLFTKKHYDLKEKKKPKKKQIAFEIKYSIVSSLLFTLSALLIAILWKLGYTRIYLKINEYPVWYLFLSLFIYSLCHEIYFYWTHVWMHNPNIFKKIHAIHHYSKQVTPWASFSFHPFETLIHAIFIPIMILLIPIHPVALIGYLVFMTITAISNHLGVELIPFSIVKRHFISGDHHRAHHERFNCNYGLYYCFMDRWLQTESKDNNSVKQGEVNE